MYAHVMSSFSLQAHVLPLVVFLAMAAVGLELQWRHFQSLFDRPRVPVLGTLVHTLTFPLIAMALIFAANFIGLGTSDATVMGILLIAACPSGGFSNVLALMAKVNLPLSVMLTVVSSLGSFLTVPLLMGGFGLLVAELQEPVRLPVVQTLVQLFLLVVLPIAVGMGLRRTKPLWVDQHMARLQQVTQLALYATAAGIVVENFSVMRAGFTEAIPWSIVLCAVNIAACLVFAKWVGLTLEDAVTVALEGSIRNLAVAFLIAGVVMDRLDIAVLPTVYFGAVLVVAILFAKTWRHYLR